MKLKIEMLRQLQDPTLSTDERARRRVQISRKFEEAGDFESAREALGDLWEGIGVRPHLKALTEDHTIGEVLLRVGALTGWIGSSQQIEQAQGEAKDLLSESVGIFERLGETSHAAEAQTELAYCYWREGAFDEARVILEEVLHRLSEEENDRRAVAILRLAIVETSTKRYNDALRLLTEAASLFEANSSSALKGRFHNELANVLNYLSIAEHRSDYVDRALVEYAAAGFHFEQANHTRNQAAVENNLGYLFISLEKFEEAHLHLSRARRLFARLKDTVHTAQVDETRARAYVAEGRYEEAEKLVRLAANILDKGGELALLSETLTTHGIALARLGRHVPARAAFLRAVQAAEVAGNPEGGGIALLSLVDELGSELGFEELVTTYRRADELLSSSNDSEILTRLRRAASKVLESSNKRSAPVKSRQLKSEHTNNGWENFSLKEEVRRLEERYIRSALQDAEGRVSQAAKLLGFADHGSLNSLLKNKYPHLNTARLPPTPRKRSLIRR
jgi:tetratricopeptide (TPR) repeat protein